MKDVYILAIESSCDDTSAAVLKNTRVLSNLIANQSIHTQYGGVVPELASRAHQVNIVPVVHEALKKANCTMDQIDAIAFTAQPGLLGSLLVGSSFAKGLGLSLNKPIIAVDHMMAHIMALFLQNSELSIAVPNYPFLCLTVSGGHSQISIVQGPNQIDIIGKTLDDAAGEAFDKIAKVLGLEYPGGPWIDRHSQSGDPLKFKFPISDMKNFDYSFSGIKTAVLYFIQQKIRENPLFIQENLADICASAQHTIVEMLLKKLQKASETFHIREVAIVGGVSANSYLRKRLTEEAQKYGWNTFVPELQYCTDNAAMIGAVAYYKYLAGHFDGLTTTPKAR